MPESIDWPKKSRDIHNHHMNSTVWDTFKFRDDDIAIASYAKSGTTWLQQIVGQLVFNGADAVDTANLSPWIDLRAMPPEAFIALEAQTHRRFVKTHLPVDALVFSPRAKYIYIGRDGRDVVWSFHNHHSSANQIWYDLMNGTPGLVGPPIERPTQDIHEYYRQWFAGDGYPIWPMWENLRSWWAIRDLPNVKLMHYSDLKRDLPGSIRSIAAFLDIPIDEKAFPAILEHCGFDYMKAHAAECVPIGGVWLEGGPQAFVYRGLNGRWKDVLTPVEVDEYEKRAVAELGPECAAWLAGAAQPPLGGAQE